MTIEQDALIPLDAGKSKYVDRVYMLEYDPETFAEETKLEITIYPVMNMPGIIGYVLDDEHEIVNDDMPFEYFTDTPIPKEFAYQVIGEDGLQPEQFEETYGPRLGLFLLMQLSKAVRIEMDGVYTNTEGKEVRYRRENLDSVRFLERVHDVQVVLFTKVYKK